MWKFFGRQRKNNESSANEFRLPFLTGEILGTGKELMNVEHAILRALLTRRILLKEEIFVQMSGSVDQTLTGLEAGLTLEEADEGEIATAASNVIDMGDKLSGARNRTSETRNKAAAEGFVRWTPSVGQVWCKVK